VVRSSPLCCVQVRGVFYKLPVCGTVLTFGVLASFAGGLLLLWRFKAVLFAEAFVCL